MGRVRGQNIIEYLIILVVVGIISIVLSNNGQIGNLFDRYGRGANTALEGSNY